MSTPPPPDRPTEPLRPRPVPPSPAPVPAPVPVVEERVVAPAIDADVLLLRLEDMIGDLRTWLVVVGLVAVAALAVAIYAAVDDDTATRSSGRTSSFTSDRATQLENRVDRLSRQIQDVRGAQGTGSDTTALANRVSALERSSSSAGQGAASGTQQAVDALSSRIDDLASDVEALKQTQTTP